jgi:hypothetical protein
MNIDHKAYILTATDKVTGVFHGYYSAIGDGNFVVHFG